MALPFRSFVTVGEVDFRDRSGTTFTQVVGDRAYAASVQDEAVEVIAVDLTTGEEAWRAEVSGAERWGRLLALPDAVVVFGTDFLQSQPRPMIVLDPDTGEERWRRSRRGDDQIWTFADTMVLADREAGRLVGLDYVDGSLRWTVRFPDGGDPTVRAVLAPADLVGPSTLAGGFPGPLHSDQVVMVGGDRSASVIDVGDGAVTTASNVADPGDLLLAYEDSLVVATAEAGYRVEAFSLTDLAGEVRTLHRAPEADRAPTLIRPCGAAGVCLLDRAARDDETIELLALSLHPEPDGTRPWRQPVPAADRVLPVGEAILVSGDGAQTVLFHGDGEQQPSVSGTAVRLDAANVLLFDAPPGAYPDDMNVAGLPLVVEEGEPERVQLGPVYDVVGERCSWNARYLACPGRDNMTIQQFVRDIPQ